MSLAVRRRGTIINTTGPPCVSRYVFCRTMPFTKWTCFLNTIHGARLSIILGQRVYPGYFIVPAVLLLKRLSTPFARSYFTLCLGCNAGVVKF